MTAMSRTPSELTASAVMRDPGLTVDAWEPALWVWKLMLGNQTEHAVVTDNGRCLGLVDVHDLWVSWAFDLTGVGGSVERRVTAVPTVPLQAPLASVCSRLLESPHGAVLVVDDTGSVRGVVTSSDIVRAVSAWSPSC